MEGLAPDYIATIGGHFFMDPSFFMRQERTCVWSNKFTPTSDALPPLTSLDPEQIFSLQYCELRQFNDELPNSPFFCKRTGRHVGMTAARKEEKMTGGKGDGEEGGKVHKSIGKKGVKTDAEEVNKTTVAILRRKVAWWSRRTSRGGWDGKTIRKRCLLLY